jgi:glycosyltransferase involved in cell wall biosynthesis
MHHTSESTAPAPSISIITATRNAERTLPGLIDSIRQQTCKDFEWVVVDGASDDSTVALLAAASDVVTKLVSEPDYGVYDALNKGIRLARGDYYLVVGADDELLPDALGHYRSLIEASGGADVISAAITHQGATLLPARGYSLFNSGPPLVSGHSVGALIKRSLHTSLGYYSRRYRIAADTYFLLNVRSNRATVYHSDKIVGKFGDGGLSGRELLSALSESFQANVEVDGRLMLQWLLYSMRLLKNSKRFRAARMSDA